MLSKSLIQSFSKRFRVTEKAVEERLRDFSDIQLQNVLAINHKKFDDLTFFLEKFQKSDEVIAHLRGYANHKEQVECWNKWDEVINEIKEEKKEND